MFFDDKNAAVFISLADNRTGPGVFEVAYVPASAELSIHPLKEQNQVITT